MMTFFLIGPRLVLLSAEFARLSPMTKYEFAGIVDGPNELVSRFSELMYGSVRENDLPPGVFMFTMPFVIWIVSPGSPITRLMKSRDAGFVTPRPSVRKLRTRPQNDFGGPDFWMKTMMSPRRGGWMR